RSENVFHGTFQGEINEVMTAARAFGLQTEMTIAGPVAIDMYTAGTPETTVASLDVTGGAIGMGQGLSLSAVNLNAGLIGEMLTVHALNSSVTAEKLSGSFAATGQATVPELDWTRTSGSFT